MLGWLYDLVYKRYHYITVEEFDAINKRIAYLEQFREPFKQQPIPAKITKSNDFMTELTKRLEKLHDTAHGY